MAGTDPTAGHRRQSYFSAGCMSPSCLPVVHEEYYTRIHDDQLTPIGSCHDTPRRRWQRIIKKIMRESKCIYGSTKPPTTFRYDAISYSQNFDDGCHKEELISRCNPQVIRVREVRSRNAYPTDFKFPKVLDP